MIARPFALWRRVSQNLAVVPGLIVVFFALLGIGLVELDGQLDLNGVQVVFRGDGSAARTVLSVIAGSLITVAGLTFSITMVVLQLASSQFSPRILRTFFGDRVTQVTIGTFVGTFVYSILVLRAVGSFGDAGFVPRLSVSLASLLGIGAAVLLIVFLHHVSLLIQVSHVIARITHDTLRRTDVLYPARDADAPHPPPEPLLRSWRDAGEPRRVFPERPGFVQRVELERIDDRLSGRAEQVAVLVCPGDFVTPETPIAEVWPADVDPGAIACLVDAVTVASERDLAQDIDFGLRQLTDTAIKAMSPGINDPTTAVTCIGYLRAILVRLAERPEPPAVPRRTDQGPVVLVRRRTFAEHLDVLLQISRYTGADAWVAGEVLKTLGDCAQAARRFDAPDRMAAVAVVAASVAEQSAQESVTQRDRDHLAALAAAVAYDCAAES